MSLIKQYLYQEQMTDIRYSTGYTLNRVNFTQDEETCILKFLNQARECGYPSGNEPWYSVIDSIIQKYYDSDIKEVQDWQMI